MQLPSWPISPAIIWTINVLPSCCIILAILLRGCNALSREEILSLRRDTESLFYHGYRNYLDHAYPEDELRPISCRPQTRNPADPGDIGLNDVLGNYSLTLIDSLSTLAILASGDADREGAHALLDFQDGVERLVDLYGHGTDSKRCGSRACGFDIDSKVQVFETNIRGVGGLLSAHLFATGALPIRGYHPHNLTGAEGGEGIVWNTHFTYNDQLLNLAYDLAERLLPAFSNPSGLPYPRVNLRYGIPFYHATDSATCSLDGPSTLSHEVTETCAAGAGSLVLEFSTLSRLTGDPRFETLAKRAFWAVWDRRSAIDLIGNGIDAESGQWTSPPLTGIGAGIDSFFEYSLKSYVLLSNLPYDVAENTSNSPDSFLEVWKQAHAAVRRHIYRGNGIEKYPYYGQVDLATGAPRYSWVDNLSAYYPGLLVLAGELEEATEAHMLFCALWTRYNALPERWHAVNAFIDPNFKHWAGRPEFIESTFHLYQATKDPYYLHVGEMALRDIRRRCWTQCGWADLGDVSTGQQRDRMESFFLGETAKYLYLLFTSNHPLNQMDKALVFSTEGHPLIIPEHVRASASQQQERRHHLQFPESQPDNPQCAAPIAPLPLTVSNAANRPDYFHAASMVQLHHSSADPTRSSPLLGPSQNHPGISYADVRSPTNFTFYPWTLPKSLIPINGFSAPIISPMISTLTFPNLGSILSSEVDHGLVFSTGVQKYVDGVVINSLSNLRLNMIQEAKTFPSSGDKDELADGSLGYEYRIHGIANLALGRDEKVMLTPQALHGVSPSDPFFTRVKDLEMIDLIIDSQVGSDDSTGSEITSDEMPGMDVDGHSTLDELWIEVDALLSGLFSNPNVEETPRVDEAKIKKSVSAVNKPTLIRHRIPAILPTGLGAAPLPPAMDTESRMPGLGGLPFDSVVFLESTLCTSRLPSALARAYKILVIQRGDCSFSEKLANIPSIPPSSDALQLVIVLSLPQAESDERSQSESRRRREHGQPNPPEDNGGYLIRPMLDQIQLTPNGIERRKPLAMVMVHGSDTNIAVLKNIASADGRLDERGAFVGSSRERRHHHAGAEAPAGIGVGMKRRFWFESMGLPIGNLVML